MKSKIVLVFLATIVSLSFTSFSDVTKKQKVKNIILVHGAFLDGSGWESAYKILVKKGYNVSVSQHKL